VLLVVLSVCWWKHFKHGMKSERMMVAEIDVTTCVRRRELQLDCETDFETSGIFVAS